MDYIWSPWRFQYISSAAPTDACIFCTAAAANKDDEYHIVHRAEHNFVILNRFPYTSGHLMIAPYLHVASLCEANEETVSEMMLLARQAEKHLRAVYRPTGLNAGLNLGECAGAGVAGHIHMHVLPRWCGDSSFMTVIGETRVLPEDLSTTYAKLSKAWSGDAA